MVISSIDLTNTSTYIIKSNKEWIYVRG
jgi:hypothetical protein